MSSDVGGRGADAADAWSATPWRVLSDEPHEGQWNMAVDDAIAQAVGTGRVPPPIRFYAWDKPTVSLGCLQAARGAVAPETASQRGIATVRRPTGGRTVLHDDELTYSVCIPLDGFWRRVSVAESFRLIGAGLVRGLRRLGVAASLGESSGPSRDRSAACFQTPRMPAVLVAGRKLVGSAQRRWETALLQHGSLLLGMNLELQQAVLPSWPREDPSRGLTWLRALLPEVPSRADLERALADGWAEVLSVRGCPGTLTGPERREAERLVVARYGNPAWTWRY